MGKNFEEQEDIDKAIKMYENAIDSDYKDSEAYTCLAIAYAKKNEDGKALSYIEDALKYNPKNDNAWNAKGVIYLGSRTETAKFCFEKALSINPQSPKYLTNIGNCYAYQGDFKNAYNYYNKALKIDPENEYTKQCYQDLDKYIESHKYNNHTPSNATDPINQGNALQLINFNFRPEEASDSITGTVRNNSNNVLKSVYIKFALFDSSGNQIGDSIDCISNLQPCANWIFKCYISEKKAVRAQMTELKYYNI
jgi:tetratricopeptide (TPR) repeat protein